MKLSEYKSYDELPLFLNAAWQRYWVCFPAVVMS